MVNFIAEDSLPDRDPGTPALTLSHRRGEDSEGSPPGLVPTLCMLSDHANYCSSRPESVSSPSTGEDQDGGASFSIDRYFAFVFESKSLL
jgi:hypothetical protein